MQLTILKSKILRAEVTETHRDYEGSLAIDVDFLNAIGLMHYEKILVGNITTGARFETYAIRAAAGSKTFSLNGAAAHLGNQGDLLVIMAFAQMSADEAATWEPRVLVLGDHNQQILELRNGVPNHPNPLPPLPAV